MKLRHKTTKSVARADKFNIHGLGEIIVMFLPDDGNDGYDQTSDFIRDYEVWLKQKHEWKDLVQAFKDKDVIRDNYNTRFFEPKTQEDRKRGYTL